MVLREKINGLICRAYKTACAHGFHDVNRSDKHFLMLIISEIGEMVEADRKNRHAAYDAVDYCDKHCDEVDADTWLSYFERDVKDTVEDELADVCIRLFDFCGSIGVSDVGVMEIDDAFEDIFGWETVCEQCFSMSCLVSDIYRCCKGNVEKSVHIGMVLSACFGFARHHGFDLMWHIENKMRYNDTRSMRHGKEY